MICDNCGTRVHDIKGAEVGKRCPICKNGMVISEAEHKEREEIREAIKDDGAEVNPFEQKDISEDTEQLLQDEMREDIEVLGNDETWYTLEEIPIASDRVLYRKRFFECGGVMPIKEGETK